MIVECSLRIQPFLLGTFATQRRQRCYTKDVNQCLHNKSGSHGVPNVKLFDFMFLLVDYGNDLCSSANELQQA